MAVEAQGQSITRNNGGRAAMEKFVAPTAWLIHKIRPTTTANEISDAAKFAALSAVVLSRVWKTRTGAVVSGSLFGVATYFDLVDGFYARTYGEVTDEGAEKDMINDKQVTSGSRWIVGGVAALKGEIVNATAQFVEGAIGPLSALKKSEAEMGGHAMRESGKWKLSKLGTHPAKVGFIAAGIVLPAFVPEKYRSRVEAGLAVINTIGGVAITVERSFPEVTGTWISDAAERDAIMEKAKKRYPAIKSFADKALTGSLLMGTGLALTKRRS